MNPPLEFRPLYRLRVAPALVVAALGGLLAACGAGGPPVAVLTVVPSRVELSYSEVRPLRLSWEIRRSLDGAEGDLMVFVHLLSGSGDVLRTFDHDFPVRWEPNVSVAYEVDLHQSVLGPPLAAGKYDIAVGLYDGAGRRWPLSTAGEALDQLEYRVAELEAVDRSSTPMFRFSEQWKPIEAGIDLQVLGRRWLTSAGSIVITETAGEGVVWMSLRVPTAEPGERRLVLDPGFQETRVMIRSGCGGSEVELTGVGTHEIKVPVIFSEVAPGDAAHPECEIRFEPNFHILTVGTTEQRSVLLEMLGWMPDR